MAEASFTGIKCNTSCWETSDGMLFGSPCVSHDWGKIELGIL